MQLRVEFYGVLRQVMGTDALVLDAAIETVDQALDQLCRLQPALAAHLSRVACAIGSDVVTRDQRLSESSTLALIPPVSGGGA